MLEERNKSTAETHELPSSSSCTSLKTVKSTAVVKYTAVQTPATFAQLQCNTDLNHPPSNWLSSSAESYGLQNVWSHNTGFSSFRMAHMFPDCVGEVDVVSDAENIKKLLKMPYSHGVVSMMVHRIENTLLLDDFDIHKYLLRQAETDWGWLKKFFYENILESSGDDEKKKKLFQKTSHNSRNTLQQKNLISKFLYHSLVLADNKFDAKKNSSEKDSSIINNVNKEGMINPLPLQSVEPMLPEPKHEDKLPDPNHNHSFTRNVVWTFENIQMLIGTDMPIFGGQTHPCISLRLRDVNKPINVLTGIDYWLDNLMSNVPEVIMCYHLDGIVKKYELIKTEDLPNLDDAQFSPKVIRDIAQNILSFLKNNATKAGHTYWLFKGKDDDVVKLYDLTSLCSDDVSNDESEKGQNPFTVPVAMLLYRVARNMKYSLEQPSRGHQGTIRTLLNNCVQLLNREKYPQIVTSAHYMLSDLYIPADTDPAKPTLVEDNYTDESANDCTNSTSDTRVGSESNNNADNEENVSATASVKSLMLSDMKVQSEQEESKYKPHTVIGNIAERCRIALDHVHNGLQCLRYFPTTQVYNDNEKDTFEDSTNNLESNNDEYTSYTYDDVKPKEEKQNMAKPFEAIPMPYYSLESLKQNQVIENTNDQVKNSSHSSIKKNQKKKNRRNDNSNTSEDRSAREKVCSDNKSIVDGKSTEKSLLLCQKTKVETLPTWEAPKKTDNHSWKAHLKTLLYEKASLIFAVLGEYEYTNQNYGASLRYIINVLKCQKILEIFCHIKNDKLISYLLGRAGDCCLMTVQDWPNINKHKEKFEINDEIDEKIVGDISKIQDDLDMNGTEYFIGALESIESCLLASHKSYEKALVLEHMEIDKKNLLRRLGNIHNELGVLYMNQASSKYQQQGQNNKSNSEDNDSSSSSDSNSTDITWLLTQSLNHLESGIRAFESVKDEANLALLHSNTGRLMRLCAHINLNKQIQERHFYKKALSSYQRALQVLGNRKTNPSIWDTINWDLSTTLFTMATLLQDYPVIGHKNNAEELERELLEILHKALKHCDCDTPGSRQLIYQFRAATIQHRLGSFHHRMYRNLECECDSVKRKSNLQLSKLHYEKAAKLFLSLEQPVEFLTVQLERVALAEYQAEVSTLFNTKLKVYQSALDYILQCQPMLQHLEIKNQQKHLHLTDDIDEFGRIEIESASNSNAEEQDLDKQEQKLVLLLEQRLQYLLKSLTKLCLGKNNISTSINKRECQNLANLYKQCYSKSLRLESQTDLPLISRVLQLVNEINNMFSQVDKSL